MHRAGIQLGLGIVFVGGVEGCGGMSAGRQPQATRVIFSHFPGTLLQLMSGCHIKTCGLVFLAHQGVPKFKSEQFERFGVLDLWAFGIRAFTDLWAID